MISSAGMGVGGYRYGPDGPDVFQHGSYELDDDPERVDVDAAWAFLWTSVYWANWRHRDDFELQLASAWRVVGAFDRSNGAMVGFARGISDGVALAYLADVYVLPESRGRGLGKALVATMIERGPGSGFRWMLHTADAHRLYEAFGFGPAGAMYMERPRKE